MTDTLQLAHALRRGDEMALAELYDRFGSAVYNLALRVTGDRAMAEEVSLDAFLQLWRQADRFDEHQGTVQSLLFTITRSRAIDRIRAASAAKRTEAIDGTAIESVRRPDEVAELAQRQLLVRRAMAKLTQPQRAALELAYYEGLSHSQIATRLGEPLGTVKTRIRQAMIALREALGPTLSTS